MSTLYVGFEIKESYFSAYSVIILYFTRKCSINFKWKIIMWENEWIDLPILPTNSHKNYVKCYFRLQQKHLDHRYSINCNRVIRSNWIYLIQEKDCAICLEVFKIKDRTSSFFFWESLHVSLHSKWSFKLLMFYIKDSQYSNS